MANNNVQKSGPSTITSPTSDVRVLNHRGTEVGDANVTLNQNDVNRLDAVVTWEVPKKYRMLGIAGGKHWTKAEFRTRETFSGDGTQTQFSLAENLIPISGEEDLAEQPYPTVIAYDTAAGAKLNVASIDYYANTVTFQNAPSTGTDNVIVWPVLGDGVVQYRGIDAFGNLVGPLNQWGVPVHVFADHNMDKTALQIHLPGAARFERSERLAFYLNAPRQVVWQDADFPDGEFVSTLEQQVDVEV